MEYKQFIYFLPIYPEFCVNLRSTDHSVGVRVRSFAPYSRTWFVHSNHLKMLSKCSYRNKKLLYWPVVVTAGL